MKNINWVITLIVLITVVFCWQGCQEKEEERVFGGLLSDAKVAASYEMVNGDSVLVLDQAKLDNRIRRIPIDSLVDSLQLVRLENSDQALVKGERIFVSENYIAIKSESYVKLFRRDGTYVSNIAKAGNGPNEFITSIYDGIIDEKNDRIYFIPPMGNKILITDLKGEPQESIPLPCRVTKARFRIDQERGEVTVMMLPFEDEVKSVIWVQDFEGNIIQEVDAKNYTVFPDYSNDLFSRQNTEALDCHIRETTVNIDTLYHYSRLENRLVPRMTIRFANEESSFLHVYTELPLYYIIWESKPWYETSYNKVIFVDKTTLQASYVRVVSAEMGEFRSWMFERGRFISAMNPYVLIEQIDKMLSEKTTSLNQKDRERALKLRQSLDEDDNDYIAIGKVR